MALYKLIILFYRATGMLDQEYVKGISDENFDRVLDASETPLCSNDREMRECVSKPGQSYIIIGLLVYHIYIWVYEWWLFVSSHVDV